MNSEMRPSEGQKAFRLPCSLDNSPVKWSLHGFTQPSCLFLPPTVYTILSPVRRALFTPR